MKTKSGFITNGTYLKYKSGFTSFWIVETENKRELFDSEAEADLFIASITIL